METSKLSKFQFENLLFEQQKVLIDELLEYTSLQNREPRNRIIKALIPTIANQVEREGSPRDVLLRIIRACDKRDEGFLSFLKALKDEEQRNEIYDELKTLTYKLLVIKEIYDLLNESSEKAILNDSRRINDFYKNSLPVNESKNLEIDEISKAIDYLSGFPRSPDATFSLLKFIKFFKFNEEDSNKLRNQLINLVKELLSLYISLSTDDINHIENFNLLQNSKENKNFKSDSLDLLIEIKLEKPPRNRSISFSDKKYNVFFYEWRSPWTEPRKLPKKISNVLEESLESKILPILGQYLCSLFPSLKPKIHFFLPTNLMYLPVDQWKVKSEDSPEAVLSENYHVILRSSPNNPERHELYVKARWNFNTINYLLIDEKEKKALRYTLKRKEHVNLIFFSFPLNHKDTDIFDIISSPYIGMPIAIWIREYCAHQELELIQAKDMNDILMKVRDIRLEAKEIEAKKEEIKHFGSHISLLLEDPNRFMPRPRTLTTPQERSSRSKAP